MKKLKQRYTRRCDICTREYQPKSWASRTCGPKCSSQRRRIQDNKIDKKCKNCETLIKRRYTLCTPCLKIYKETTRKDFNYKPYQDANIRLTKLAETIDVEPTKPTKEHRKLYSRDPEIQKHLDEYYKKGGIVEKYGFKLQYFGEDDSKIQEEIKTPKIDYDI